MPLRRRPSSEWSLVGLDAFQAEEAEHAYRPAMARGHQAAETFSGEEPSCTHHARGCLIYSCWRPGLGSPLLPGLAPSTPPLSAFFSFSKLYTLRY